MSSLKVSMITKCSLAALSAVAMMGFVASEADAAILYSVDNSGNMWQLDTTASGGTGAYTKLTLSGNYTDSSGNVIAGPSIRGLAVDSAGNLYTGSNSTGGLYKVSVSGTTGAITRIGGTWTGISDLVTDGTYLYVGAGSTVNRVNISTGIAVDKIGGATWNGSVAGLGLGANGTVYFAGRLSSSATSSSIYNIASASTAATQGTPQSPAFSSASPTGTSLRDAVVFNGVVLASESDYKIVSTATLTTFIDLSSLTVGSTTAALSPYQMSVDTDLNHLFVYGIFGSTNSIFEFDATGALVRAYNTPGNAAFVAITTTIAAVPEVASLSLLTIGAGALLMRRRNV